VSELARELPNDQHRKQRQDDLGHRRLHATEARRKVTPAGAGEQAVDARLSRSEGRRSGAPDGPVVAGLPDRIVGTPSQLGRGVPDPGPTVVVRFAGVPVAALLELTPARVARELPALVRLGRDLTAEGRSLADDLHDVIGLSADPEVKPGLVGLRRALHATRRPKRPEWNPRIERAVPEPIRNRIDAWLDGLGDLEARRRDFPALVDQESATVRGKIRSAAGNAYFRHALALSSTTLSDEVDKWLSDECRSPRRRSVVQLVTYLARATTKTSPFSTYTVVGTGGWSTGGPATTVRLDGAVDSVVDLDSLYQVVRAVCAQPHLLPLLSVRLNRSTTVLDGQVAFLGPQPEEHLVSLPLTSAVGACLRLLGETEPVTVDTAADRLSSVGSRAAAERFVGRMLGTGLLERVFPVADQADDPLGELAVWLREHEQDRTAGLVGELRRQLRRRVRVPDVDAQRGRLHAVESALHELSRHLSDSGRGVRLADSVLHETALVRAPAVSCALPRWRTALADLDAVRRSLAVLDRRLPLRVALAQFAVERFGTDARVPFLELHRAVRATEAGGDDGAAAVELTALLRGGPLLAPDLMRHSRLPRLRELHRLRAGLGELIDGSRCPDGVVRVSPARLARLADTWPAWVTAPLSLGSYVQCHGRGDRVELVTNVLHSGSGRGLTRVLRLRGERAGPPPPLPASGPVPAEFGSAFGLSFNRVVPSQPYELGYPWSVSDRPAEHRIELGDLDVTHDAETGHLRLESRRLGREIRPLHLGMLADPLLPPAAALLTQAFGGVYYSSQRSPLFPGPAACPGVTTVTRTPRVSIGDVTVQRARWVASRESVPTRAPGHSDGKHLLRLAGWLDEHGIPDRTFVRLLDEEADYQERARWAGKPMYLDVANPYLVLAFEHGLRRTPTSVVFEEPLPAPADSGGHGRVTEFLIEISAPGSVDG
jgi:hypothetical protein